MKIVALLNVVSPHQLPLARELVKIVGEDNYRYVYVERSRPDRVKLGWVEDALPSWCIPLSGNEKIVEDAEVLYSGVRNIELFERRARAGKKTFYYSERWFKPVHGLPGRIRMLIPRYRKMAKRFVAWLNSDSNARYLPIGPWAIKDMEAIGLNALKIVPWGYFVEPSNRMVVRAFDPTNIKLLWVGRLLGWKRVDDIVRAVGTDPCGICLDIYGHGPEEDHLRKLIKKLRNGNAVRIHPPVPIREVRRLMREHDVYVLSSNAYEGWGAVVSEALEEGMKVVGTYEAGSSATILPPSNLYHAGDWRRLAELIRGEIPFVDIGEWSARAAARKLMAL